MASCEKLSNLKESYPIKVTEYANGQGMTDEPVFTWWVHCILKSRDHIVSAVNKHYHKWTHKFGFKIPKTIKQALEIDKENSNTYWRDAIAKEMDAV